MPNFSKAFRGYDKRQVDEFVANIGHRAGRPEFDVVLSGYDRHEVEDWLSERLKESDGSAAPSAPVYEFDTVIRGYNRREVDRLLARLYGTLGLGPLDGAPLAVAALDEVELEVVMRGYDRKQVDGLLLNLREQLSRKDL